MIFQGGLLTLRMFYHRILTFFMVLLRFTVLAFVPMRCVIGVINYMYLSPSFLKCCETFKAIILAVS